MPARANCGLAKPSQVMLMLSIGGTDKHCGTPGQTIEIEACAGDWFRAVSEQDPGSGTSVSRWDRRGP